MIEELQIQRFGCIKSLSVKFTGLHCLIGPNDAGKSTVLRAVRVLSALMGFEDTNPNARSKALEDFEAMQNKGLDPPTITAMTPGNIFSRLSGDADHLMSTLRTPEIPGWGVAPKNEVPLQHLGLSGAELKKEAAQRKARAAAFKKLKKSMGSATLIRLNPDMLQQPSRLIEEGASVALDGSGGAGIAGVYDSIISRDIEGALSIQRRVQELFPAVKKVQLKNTSDTKKTLEVELRDGQRVPASHMSTGLLYYLVFAALEHLDRASILLVEEPENGLHPARIREVVSLLRELSKETQVIIATHSPLVINELEPEEITIITRDAEAGTMATPLTETPNFNERAEVYALGELWVSYADGDQEAQLTPKTAKK